MNRFFRITLLWLLMLALPAQGMAAATMAFCGPMHRSIAAGADGGTHDGHGPVGEDVQGERYRQHLYSGFDESDLARGTHQNPLGKISCSVCAACCIGAAVSAPVHGIPDLYIASGAIPDPVQARFADFIPARPEHPPRIILV